MRQRKGEKEKKRDRVKEKKREQKEGLTGWRIRQGKEQTFRGKRE